MPLLILNSKRKTHAFPGPGDLQYDETTDTGYYGFVPATDFISGDELSSQLNFNAGTNQNSDAGWLKFYVGPSAVCNSDPGTAKILFVAKKTLKEKVTWLNIDGSNLLSGNRTISIKDQLYKVRILKGGALASKVTGTEWNELMYRVHQEQPEGKSNWAFFTNTDLHVGPDLNGCNTICQERWGQDAGVQRGNTGISYWNYLYWGWWGGWRPVLEINA
jgi:hypothetical protein